MQHRRSWISLVLAAGACHLMVLAWIAFGIPVAAVNSVLAFGQAPPQSLRNQTPEDVARKSEGCLTCHRPDENSMHAGGVAAGCTDCHGGNAGAAREASMARGSDAFERVKRDAHVVEPWLDIWKTSANPAGVWYETLNENADFIRFVNPGDLRVARVTCGRCHAAEVFAVEKSMMRHGGGLWTAALYNNGSYPFKTAQFGEFYTVCPETGCRGDDGLPAIGYTQPEPSSTAIARNGVLPSLQPLFPFQVTQPGNLLRIFERGGRKPLETGNPDADEWPGRPANRLSDRGLGTLNRTDPVFIGLQKTRLMDPTLNFMGTNDVAGDFRSGGCTACHVVYANDRSPVHSAGYADAGHLGRTRTTDEMIPRDESGHPIAHVLTRAIPTSQCMTCHMHPGTNMLATYQGLTWWDNETDGDRMYPARERRLSDAEKVAIQKRNPEGSAVRGLWSDPDFLHATGSPEFNQTLSKTQFADFHGHSWLFRAVFKRDGAGRLIDAQGSAVTDTSSTALAEAVSYRDLRPDGERPPTPAERAAERAGRVVHLKDIHLERGMQCVDCHFKQDSHGNGNLYGEPRNAVEIACVDCHGTPTARATLLTSGPAAPLGGTNLRELGLTPWQLNRFTVNRSTQAITQNSMVIEGLSWVVPQIIDSVTPGHPRYNERAAVAKTIRRDGASWGDATATDLAHVDSRMTCATCHTAWVTSCFGCHLSQTANQKRPLLHNELGETRNWTSYNFQVLRDDVFMLGKDGSVIGNRISPVRSSSAVVVSSQDLNRQWIYAQQQTVSAEGFAGQAFNTHVPHTVRTTETRTCTSCHLSKAGDNNALMAQLLLLGTNFVNFMGRFVYVATGSSGIEAVAVTEMDEPQAVIGSDLHRLAYPSAFEAHERRGRRLTTAIRHGSTNALGVQARGEYLYIADGEGGFRAYDIAQVYQKGFSQKIVTAPVSPLGQRLAFRSPQATAVAAPSTMAVDPARTQFPDNQEQPIAPLYGYLYVTDSVEGLIITGAATLLDGNPSNNFMNRALTFNPGGRLAGARNLTIAGNYAYVLCNAGLVIIDISTPLAPRIVAEIGAPQIRQGTSIGVQFRYAFVTDADGLKVVDVTHPARPRPVPEATVPLREARSVYVARTYAYVAGGSEGLVIVDVSTPERPRVDQVFTAGGQLDDTRDVKVAMTNASVFGYVADGRNGLRVLQLVSANRTEGAFGFSPRPQPELIATYPTRGPALAISEGLDRDRAVDESGNQVAVFGRLGGRPFTLEEMQRLYLRDGEVWYVDDAPPSQPVSAGLLRRGWAFLAGLLEGRR